MNSFESSNIPNAYPYEDHDDTDYIVRERIRKFNNRHTEEDAETEPKTPDGRVKLRRMGDKERKEVAHVQRTLRPLGVTRASQLAEQDMADQVSLVAMGLSEPKTPVITRVREQHPEAGWFCVYQLSELRKQHDNQKLLAIAQTLGEQMINSWDEQLATA
jgi:hypothetical protein